MTASGLRLFFIKSLFLGGLALSIFLARGHTFSEPLERDLTIYIVAAREMRAGRLLYSDIWENKPPLVYLTYGLADFIFDDGEIAIFVLGVSAAIITLAGVFVAGAASTRAGGLWAALFWCLICHCLVLEANQPNTEVFINACLTWGFALLLLQSKTPEFPTASAFSPRLLAVSGLFAAASFYKPVAFFPAVLLALTFVWPQARAWFSNRDKARASLFPILAPLALLLLPTVLAALGTAVYFYVQGRYAEFHECLIAFNSRGARSGLLENFARGFVPHRLWKLSALHLLLLLPLCLWGLLAARRAQSTLPMHWRLWSAWALGTIFAIAAPGRFHPHYYQLWLPVFAVGSAWAISEIARSPVLAAKRQAILAGATVALLLLFFELSHFRLPPDEWSRQKYGDVFVEAKELGLNLHHVLKPNETFYQWGAETGLYFYSRKPTPTGVFYNYAVRFDMPLARQRLLRDVRRANPPLAIVRTEDEMPPELRHWLTTHYRPFRKISRPNFELWARRGSALEKRLQNRKYKL